MIKMTAITALAALVAMPLSAAKPAVTVNYDYKDVDSGKVITNSASTKMSLGQIIKGGDFYSHPKMEKTATVVEFSKLLEVTLANWDDTCDDNESIQTDEDNENSELKFTEVCQQEKNDVVGAFAEGIYAIENKIAKVEQSNKARILSFMSNASDDYLADKSKEYRLNEHLTRAKKLLILMREAKPEMIRPFPMMFARAAASPRLSVTTGGAQDARKYRDKVDGKQIPTPKDFAVDGFIKEFDLSLQDPCKEKFCMSPAVAYNAETKTLLVQSSFETSITEASYSRKDSNIGILIDISGSMHAKDNTAQTRLDWAKDAVNKTLQKVRFGKDYLTISAFTTDARQIWPLSGQKIAPVTKEDIPKIMDAVNQLEASGSTNLGSGLDLSYSLINQTKKVIGLNQAKKYNHRVIMITDANLNYGDKKEADVFKKVVDMAAPRRDIGLTVIGVGLNFFQDFVDKLGNTRGGNYIFAQNGQDMLEYFKGFNLLISPVAYDFSAELDYDSSQLEFVRVHGVGGEEAANPMDNIMDIKTLFFVKSAESGGGAVVQEYKVK